MKRLAVALLSAGIVVLSATAAQASQISQKSQAISYGSYGNSTRFPDCAVATAADLTQLIWEHPKPYPEKPILTEFNPVGASTSGVYPRDIFRIWETEGIAGRRIAGVEAIGYDQASITAALAQSRYVYALVDIAALYPGEPFSVSEVKGEPSEGPHAIAVVGVARGGLWIVTWGNRVFMAWSVFEAESVGVPNNYPGTVGHDWEVIP